MTCRMLIFATVLSCTAAAKWKTNYASKWLNKLYGKDPEPLGKWFCDMATKPREFCQTKSMSKYCNHLDCKAYLTVELEWAVAEFCARTYPGQTADVFKAEAKKSDYNEKVRLIENIGAELQKEQKSDAKKALGTLKKHIVHISRAFLGLLKELPKSKYRKEIESDVKKYFSSWHLSSAIDHAKEDVKGDRMLKMHQTIRKINFLFVSNMEKSPTYAQKWNMHVSKLKTSEERTVIELKYAVYEYLAYILPEEMQKSINKPRNAFRELILSPAIASRVAEFQRLKLTCTKNDGSVDFVELTKRIELLGCYIQKLATKVLSMIQNETRNGVKSKEITEPMRRLLRKWLLKHIFEQRHIKYNHEVLRKQYEEKYYKSWVKGMLTAVNKSVRYFSPEFLPPDGFKGVGKWVNGKWIETWTPKKRKAVPPPPKPTVSQIENAGKVLKDKFNKAIANITTAPRKEWTAQDKKQIDKLRRSYHRELNKVANWTS